MKHCLYFPIFAFVVIVFVFPQITLANNTAKELASQSMEECQRGRSAEARQIRLAHFERAQELAEQAVALNDQSPDAHYSLFCTLGEQLRIDGENLMAAFGFPKMMAELDRTLELNPNHLSAISSKATFLVRLPSLFGGDMKKGKELLRRVIREDPKCINARLTLARVLADDGEYSEAIALATTALKFSEESGQQDFIKDSKQMLTQLQSKHLVSR
jgi:tetratricopeptide (TPR) repeat protein